MNGRPLALLYLVIAQPPSWIRRLIHGVNAGMFKLLLASGKQLTNDDNPCERLLGVCRTPGKLETTLPESRGFFLGLKVFDTCHSRAVKRRIKSREILGEWLPASVHRGCHCPLAPHDNIAAKALDLLCRATIGFNGAAITACGVNLALVTY